MKEEDISESTMMMDSGKIVKPEGNYSSDCDVKIPESKKLACEGKLHDALDQLLALEKLARTVECIRNVLRCTR